jgi:prepilin-type N-terminal cleavage/methylation domain-containing protein/prepilin-type processing-associated H-X9-DG protein
MGLNFDCRNRNRCGVTLLETLVALSVVAVLFAVAVPAVQSARETQRRALCQNRLRQIGAAAHAHEAAHQLFFGRQKKQMLSDGRPGADWRSIQVWLLPFLDQAALAARIDLNDDGMGAGHDPPTSVLNAALLQVNLPILECLSDQQLIGAGNYMACRGTSFHAGEYTAVPEVARALCGFASFGRGCRSRDIIDGLSHTVFFSERLVGDGDAFSFDRHRDVVLNAVSASTLISADDGAAICQAVQLDGIVEHASFVNTGWVYRSVGRSEYVHVLKPNSPVPDCTTESETRGVGAYTARSHHPGGVNVLMGDGAVHFVSDGVDLAVWRAAASVAGHETAASLE